MKWMAVLVVSCMALPMTGQTPQTHSNQKQQPQKQRIGEVQVGTVNVNTLNVPEKPPDKNAEKLPSYLQRLMTPETLPNSLLCLIGFLGVVAAFYTLAVIRKQTKIQAAGMRQWIDVEPRSVEVKEGIGEKQNEMRFLFQAANDTNYPLKIEKIVVWIAYWADTWDTSEIKQADTLVPPRKKHHFYAVRKCDKSDVETFKKGTTYTINGVIYFTDCLGEKQIQGFSGLYDCSPTKFQWMQPYGTVPEHEVEYARTPKFRGEGHVPPKKNKL